jgi:hypothetical protein
MRTNEAALEEARKYGLSRLEQGMIQLVWEFGKVLAPK